MLKNCGAIAAALFLLCGLFPGVAYAAQTNAQSGSPFVVDVWGTANGLPDDTVLSVIQTRDGYLWVGTLHGLVRFDGLRFTPFDETGSLGLASKRIVHLFEDSRSNLWVGTESSGIVLVKKNGEIEHFSIGAGTLGGQLASATEDANGTVWMRLLNGTVVRYWNNKVEPVFGPFRAVMAERNGPLWLATDSELYPVVAPAGSSAMIVQQQMQVPMENFKFLLAGRTEGYWRFAGGRVQKWKGNQLERDLGAYPWDKTPIMAACEDDKGNLIVGTYGDGVYWFDANGKYTHILSELTHGSVLSLAFDSEGNLWVGTNGKGLNRVKRRAFSVLPISKDRVVQSVSPDKSGGLWIAYNGNYVDHWSNGVSEQFSPVQDPRFAAGAYAKSVFATRDGRVFAGVSASIPGQRLFEWAGKQFAPASEMVDSDISAIFQDRAGRIWIGTQAGLLMLDGKDSKWFKDGLPSLDVSAIADDADGNLWIGTGAGLACMRDGKFTSFHKKPGGLPSEEISSLLMDSDGVLWIGTRGSGLVRFFKNQWTQYTTAQGLAGNSIGYLIEDSETNLWLGSNAGLTRVAKKSLNDFASGAAQDVICSVYVENDGLPTRECTEGSQPAAAATPDGTLWFPTTRGLVYVHPAGLKRNLREPRVVIESVWVEDQKQNTNRLDGSVSKVVIPPEKGHLDIYYASLNLGAADRSRFRYRLKDETPWIDDKSANRVASFQKLAPGTYQFEVTACNEDGVWSSQPAEMTIVAQPALWQKAWFRAAVAMGLIGTIAGIVYYFATQKLQRQVALLRQQEALEQERARIARDLHDQLGANLTQMALLAEMAESDKDIPAEVEDHAQQITQTARETTKALDEIVWAVNPSNDTLEGLVNYSAKYAQEYFTLAGLRYRVDIPSQLPDVTLPPEVRHNVFLAFKESVNNVVKHAQATEVHLRLKLNQNNVALEIEDNGRGPAGAAQKTGRNGLRNMRKRMEDVGGSFSMEPAAGQGTLVRLTAPIKINDAH